MSKFSFDEQELKVLANFASLNQQMLIEPDKFSVSTISKSVIAIYPFANPYPFQPFGLFDTSDFLAIIQAMKNSQIEVKYKFLNIIGDAEKFTYYTTAEDLVPKVPDAGAVFANLDYDLEFSLPADKLAGMMKMSAYSKAPYLFFEADSINGGPRFVRMTLNDDLENASNNWQRTITDGVKVNKLEEAVKIAMVDFKILPGEYEVGIAKKVVKGKNKYFSRWSNLNGATYYITTDAVG